MGAVGFLGYDLAECANHLRVLAGDLERIAAGTAPTPSDLANAPVLSPWHPDLTGSNDAAITGVVSGHAGIADGDTVIIELIAADADLKWIRSFTGWYVLGTPARGADGYRLESGSLQ